MSAPHPRTARSGSDLRILRAAVFAAVCVVLAAAGHAIASCAAVPLWTLGAGFLGTWLIAVPLFGRARSLPVIAALLAGGQTVLHMLFGLGQHGAAVSGAAGGTAGGAAASVATDASLVEQAARLVCGTTAAAISPAQAQRILADARIDPGAHLAHQPADALSTEPGSWAALLPSLPMLLGHVLAGLAAGWLLRRGDLALLRILALSAETVAEGALVRSLRGALALARALCAGLAIAPQAGPRFRRTAPLAAPEPRTLALQHTVIRRGPPAAAFLLAA
ncbi:hypothetical protein ACWC10_30140 [Streptomyces sp. NPDC001595]|uniref:hypothetical protein n=1 Tax=Streptomyces sp. NPDC001532 TaxID=3154520 RepID=UPI00331AF54F